MSAFKSSHEGYKTRSRRRVISFDEALESLKGSQTGFVVCAAIHSFGRCRKEITMLSPQFHANLDQLELSDVQTPIKLMPLMLCSTHWGKTVYYNALFLGWLSSYGSKQDHPHFENIVIDYQSAIAIDSAEQSLSEAVVPSSSISYEEMPIPAPSSSTRGK